MANRSWQRRNTSTSLLGGRSDFFTYVLARVRHFGHTRSKHGQCSELWNSDQLKIGDGFVQEVVGGIRDGACGGFRFVRHCQESVVRTRY